MHDYCKTKTKQNKRAAVPPWSGHIAPTCAMRSHHNIHVATSTNIVLLCVCESMREAFSQKPNNPRRTQKCVLVCTPSTKKRFNSASHGQKKQPPAWSQEAFCQNLYQQKSGARKWDSTTPRTKPHAAIATRANHAFAIPLPPPPLAHSPTSAVLVNQTLQPTRQLPGCRLLTWRVRHDLRFIRRHIFELRSATCRAVRHRSPPTAKIARITSPSDRPFTPMDARQVLIIALAGRRLVAGLQSDSDFDGPLRGFVSARSLAAPKPLRSQRTSDAAVPTIQPPAFPWPISAVRCHKLDHLPMVEAWVASLVVLGPTGWTTLPTGEESCASLALRGQRKENNCFGDVDQLVQLKVTDQGSRRYRFYSDQRLSSCLTSTVTEMAERLLHKP